MPTTTLDTGDAVELAELLQFLADWLAADHYRLDASLHRFVGTHGYDVASMALAVEATPLWGMLPRRAQDAPRP